MLKLKKRLLLLITIIALMLAACGETAQDSAPQTSAEETDEPNEPNVITIASIGNSNYDTLINRFNANNGLGITVKMVDYSWGGSREDAIRRLNMELAAGKGPDIIDFESFPHRERYAKQGYLSDLSGYFGDELKIEDYFALDVLVSPELYYVPSAVSIMTCYGLSSVLQGKESWSFDEYAEFFSQSQYIDPNIGDQENFLTYACMSMIPQCVDWSNKSCDFESDAFKGVLVLVNSLGQNSPQYQETYGDMLKSGLMAYTENMMIHVTDLRYIELDLGAPVTFIGYPTADGSSGNYLYLCTLAGINAASPKAEQAWEFIKYMISDDEFQAWTALDGIPVKKSAYEENLRELQDPMAKYDGHEITLNEDGSFSVDGVYMDQEYDPTPIISQEQADKFLRLIESADSLYDYDPDIMGIIDECSAKYFAGDKSLDETVSDIQSRVSIYLAEQG